MRINKILEKYSLLKTFETELNIEPEVFVGEMKKLTEKGYYSPILATFDIFSSHKKRFVGYINNKSFTIRETYYFKNKILLNTSKVKAEYYKDNGALKIKTQIRGMKILPFILRGIIALICLLLMSIALLEILLMSFSSDSEHVDVNMISGPLFLTFFIYLFTYLPYQIGKKNTSKMKSEMEIIYEKIEKTPYNNVYN